MILTCGEALIDMLPRQTQTGEAAFVPYPGGAVFNTAIALGRLGAPVDLFSGISTDLFGQILERALFDSDVGTGLLARSDRPTTLAFVTLVDGQASYAFYDENTAGRMISGADVPDTDANILFFAGISLAVEPCAAVYEQMMLAHAPTRITMIDPNIRPGFINDEASYRARMDRMLGAADIVKLSDEDLHWLCGAGDPVDLARNILDRGPGMVFLTEGADGARALTRDHDIFVPAQKVEVIDTVGAGDTFNAGILAALYEGGLRDKVQVAQLGPNQLRDALDLGIRAAAITVSRAGANPPKRNEL